MPEPDETVQKLSQQLRALRDECAEREKKLINNLRDSHAREIQKLQAGSTQRERKFLNDCKADYQARTRELVMAFLKLKAERDNIIFAISWIAVGILAIIAFRGLLHGILSEVFMFAALAGFIGAIIFTGQSLKWNSRHLQRAMEGPVHPDSVWEENDSRRPLRFLIFGVISAVLLGLAMFIKSPVKIAVLPQTSRPSVQKSAAVQARTAGAATGSHADLKTAASVPVANNRKLSSAARKVTHGPLTPAAASTVKLTGNGGNFVGGSYGK